MAEGSPSNLLWLAQSVPLCGLLCYVAYQWRNLLSTVLLIAALYSFGKNILSLLIDTHKVPKSAFILLVFYDMWVGLVKLSKYIFLDPSYSRALLDGVMRLTGKSCPTTNLTVHKINKEVEVYVYKPGTVSNKGCVVYIHGGGWCYLSARGFSGTLSYMSHYLEMVVVSVEYRLAPEHPFPAGLVDCYSAVQWVHDNCELLEVDTDNVFIAGDSAGGNLSAAVSLLYRDRQGAPLDTELLDTADEGAHRAGGEKGAPLDTELLDTADEGAHRAGGEKSAPLDTELLDTADEGAHRAGGERRPGLAGQILLYPVLQGYSNSHTSMIDNSSYFPPPDLMPTTISLYASGSDRFSRWLGDPLKIRNKAPKFWKTVVSKTAGDTSELCTIKEVKKLAQHAGNATFEEIMGNSYILPLHAEDVSNLPPAYVLVAAADTLRDEGEWYARYLQQSGNSVVFSEVKHCHGFMMRYGRNVYARNELMKIKEFIGQNTK